MTFTYEAYPQDRVHFGKSVRETLGDEVERLGAKRVFIASSKTLRQNTGALSLIATTLGAKCVAIFDDIAEHAKLDGVLAATKAARETKADLLVGIGGGSVIDGLKVVQLALTENADTPEALIALAGHRHTKPATIRQIAIPTTLSGAETTPFGGGTDAKRGKLGFAGLSLVPQVIIYDPALGALTAEWLWLSSAIRGVDHCCEGYIAKNANPLTDIALTRALSLFATSLRHTKKIPGDPFARIDSQVAAYLACANSSRSGTGASHGIGYILGGRYGVHHGHSSCVMLPHVLRWNEPATAARQRELSAAIGNANVSLADAVAALVAELGLPQRLRDVGIKEENLKPIAEEAAGHPTVLSNPRPITGPGDIMEILKAAW
jgi:alcohol dehydrogenase class IV